MTDGMILINNKYYMDNLNKQYFDTRKKHKDKSKKKKLTLKRALLNIIITVVLILIYTFFQNHLNKKIEENKMNDVKMEYQND